jgi:poly(3-hydroxybutyrate) depolymerase
LRGQFSVTGGEVDLTGFSCTGPVASIWIHDQNDTANVYSGTTTARDRVLATNGCSGSATETWDTGDIQIGDRMCVKYTDCPAEYPVILCTSQTQGHGDQQAFAIPAFTRYFEEMAAQ